MGRWADGLGCGHTDRMTKSPAILLAVTALVTVAGCGSGTVTHKATASASSATPTPSVRTIANATQLKDEAVAAGFSCPAWKALPQPVEGRTEGQCSDTTLLVVMESADARQEFTDKMKGTKEAPCILWGKNWAIYASSDELAKVKVAIGGTLLATPTPTPAPAESEATADPSMSASSDAEESTPEATETATTAAAEVPAEYANALDKAESYVSIMHMSKKGLYRQLTSSAGEGFDSKAAQYAVDHVTADWNANALAKAKEYQSVMHMSRSAIREQLTSSAGEQFTAAEADYAIEHLA